MYFLTHQAFRLAGLVSDSIGRFLTSRADRFQHAALIECELKPFANLGLPSKNAGFAEQDGIIRASGENGVGVVQVVGVPIILVAN